uniref:Uncharacterized protein n=1 Tax=Octopus bimaculoides TaxID=37653 RepID=A0A0L8HPB7_OCTBM
MIKFPSFIEINDLFVAVTTVGRRVQTGRPSNVCLCLHTSIATCLCRQPS